MSKIDHDNNITIVCPYCGYKFLDPLEEEPGQEDIGDVKCPQCEKIFVATRNVSITYTTQKRKQPINPNMIDDHQQKRG